MWRLFLQSDTGNPHATGAAFWVEYLRTTAGAGEPGALAPPPGRLRRGAAAAGRPRGRGCDGQQAQRVGGEHVLLADLSRGHRLGGSEDLPAQGSELEHHGLGVPGAALRERAKTGKRV